LGLVKNSNDVYSVTTHILKGLKRYRRIRGVQTHPKKAALIYDLKPQHVYQKTLELINKINLIRVQQQLGEIAEPRYPLRTITPAEVFNLALRVDEELELLYRHSEVTGSLWITDINVHEYENKTPSDVFHNMQKISLLLDTLLSSDAFSPNDVYREAQLIQDEIKILASRFGNTLPDSIWLQAEIDPTRKPEDVLKQVEKVLVLVFKMERRAGLFLVRDISAPPDELVTPAEVYNMIRVLSAEVMVMMMIII
jgi:hypothetical protein